MKRASRKRKVETIILSDSEEEQTPSQSAALRQPLQLSQPIRQANRKPALTQPAVTQSVLAQPAVTLSLSAHAPCSTETELLVRKCAPSSSNELVVQKKKIGEVRDWLCAQHHSALLLLSGPAGCGKTCTVKVLAAELGLAVTEWTTPTPTLWAEHLQQRAAGTNGLYSSKLDDFEDFVSHAKLSTLSLQAARSHALPTHRQNTQQQHTNHPSSDKVSPSTNKLILIEDLPNCSDAQQRQRLADLLGSIAGVAKCRVIVTATVSAAQGGQDRPSSASTQGLHKDLLAAINAAGAGQISFNPVTKPNIQKALQQVSLQAGFSMPADTLTSIADSANGDLRNAIETLQLAAAGASIDTQAVKGQKGKAKRGKKAKAQPSAAAAAASNTLPSFGKDTGFALFHALGKILYNKRPDDTEASTDDCLPSAEAEQSAVPNASHAMQMPSSSKQLRVSDRHKRPRLGVDPEAVTLKSGLEASTAAAFLHENMLEFVHQDAVEDAAEACLYLSHAARMMEHGPSLLSDWSSDDAFSGQSLIEAAAGSTVLRGLLYSLMHPAARRFLSLKSPALFTNTRAAALNKQQLQALCWCPTSVTGSARVTATDSLPYVRSMISMSAQQELLAKLPTVWHHVHNNEIVGQSSHQLPRHKTQPGDGAQAFSTLSITHQELSDDAIESE